MISTYGKQLIAITTYQKGKEFIAASILLSQAHKANTHVSIYLFLQGLEIILKGMLQIVSYDLYNDKRLAKKFKHDIFKLLNEVISVYKVSKVDSKVREKLSDLIGHNNFAHFRYAGPRDVFFDASQYDLEIILKKLFQIMKYMDNKYFKKKELGEVVNYANILRLNPKTGVDDSKTC